ncbi:hypothetical protein Bca52824_036562 [Brassica carinata]|uniref:F-box domain-containing protein n=1 Tax=Brassica carinata TaxID=52824 RepID=A0A8X7V1N3_BRACI|nr:hypothetical protein Bca52824_036562 [Brassica carinata]
MIMETQTHLMEVLQTEILARLPLKTIFRFKSVCKTWKSTIESAYFRCLFLSLHQNSSSSWSLLSGPDELIGFHGCKTWDLPKSPASLIPPSFKRYHIGDCKYVDSSSGLVFLSDGSDKAYCYVGSPVLQQWIKLPPPLSDPKGDSTVFGLVTRLDEDGVVLSFKVIRIASVQTTTDYLSSDLSVLHVFFRDGDLDFQTHDFYSESDQFRVVQLPDYPDHNKDYKRTLTTSGGFVVYVRTLAKKEETVLKIWRLNNDDDSWQLLWEVGFPIIRNYAPMAMHPFDVATVYLWNYTILRNASNDGHQDCFIDKFVCKKNVEEIWDPRSSSDLDEHLEFRVCIWFCPFVIPRWMESVPCPPQAEMIDMTSLLSYATATHERMIREHEAMMRDRDNDYFWM